MRGRLMGNPFTGYCVGNRGICVLLFHRNYRPSSVLEDITFATLQNNSKNKSLTLKIDYSMSSGTEKSYWSKDINNWYVELFSDIILSDNSLLEEINAKNNTLLKQYKDKQLKPYSSCDVLQKNLDDTNFNKPVEL